MRHVFLHFFEKLLIKFLFLIAKYSVFLKYYKIFDDCDLFIARIICLSTYLKQIDILISFFDAKLNSIQNYRVHLLHLGPIGQSSHLEKNIQF